MKKGCQVHYTRSVKRVAERVNKGDPEGYKAFTAIAYAVLKAENPKQISKLSAVLAGEADVSTVSNIGDLGRILGDHKPSTAAWSAGRHWVSWWERPKHLSKLLM